ncbi:g-patch domain protein [Botrytis cinerea]
MLPSSDAPKISMKGFSLGAGSKNGSLKSNGRPQPKSGLGKRPRSSFAHDDEDSDNSDNGTSARRVKHEAVTGFADGGVIREGDEKRVAAPLVIPKQENKDWKGEARERKGRGRNLLPEEEQRRRAGEENEEKADVVKGNDEEIKWGLTVKTKVKEELIDSERTIEQTTQVAKVADNPKIKTEDELAIEALMGSKEDAYKRAIASAPDISTLEDYDAVPVEEFGAALLRGMGWDGKERKGGGKEVKRRQNLLGLGAKELKDAEELGAWVQKTDAKRLRPGGSSHSHRGSDRDKKKMGDYARERDERSHRRDRDEGRDRERVRERDRHHDRDSSYRRDRDDHRERRSR